MAVVCKKQTNVYETSTLNDFTKDTSVKLAMHGPCMADPRFLNFII